MLWTDKIDNAESFDALYRNLNVNERAAARTSVEQFRMDWSNLPWWARREAVRMSKTYDTTSVIDQINQKFPVFAHVSTEDRTMVAYTVDAASGQQDRQSRLSIGKLIGKLMPLLSENMIRGMVETHNAEACCTVSFLDSTEIPARYRKWIGTGIGACMSKNFNHTNDPACAYVGVKGLQLAVITNSSGDDIARTLVYCPTEDDKRYIRCYGSPTLKKWLERNGYKSGNLSGAVLATVHTEPVPSTKFDPDMYSVPYLDANGGMSAEVGSTVALLDGRMTVLTATQIKTLRNLGFATHTGSSTGYLRTTNISVPDMNVTCALTGRTVNKLTFEGDLCHVWHNGEKKEALLSAAMQQEYTNLLNQMYVKDEDTIRIGMRTYINDVEILKREGFIKLDATLYPEEQDWKASYSCSIDYDGRCIKSEDSVAYISFDDELSRVHKSSIPTEAIKLYGKNTAYAHKDSSWTKAGRGLKVHPRIHDITTLYTGETVFSRGVKSVYALNKTFSYKGTLDRQHLVDSEAFAEAFNEFVDDYRQAGRTQFQQICAAWRYFNDTWLPTSEFEDKELRDYMTADMRATRMSAGHLAIMPNDMVRKALPLMAKVTRLYAGIPTIRELVTYHFYKKALYALAEMDAVEAPHYLAPTVEDAPAIDNSAASLVDAGLAAPAIISVTQSEQFAMVA